MWARLTSIGADTWHWYWWEVWLWPTCPLCPTPGNWMLQLMRSCPGSPGLLAPRCSAQAQARGKWQIFMQDLRHQTQMSCDNFFFDWRLPLHRHLLFLVQAQGVMFLLTLGQCQWWCRSSWVCSPSRRWWAGRCWGPPTTTRPPCWPGWAGWRRTTPPSPPPTPSGGPCGAPTSGSSGYPGGSTRWMK